MSWYFKGLVVCIVNNSIRAGRRHSKVNDLGPVKENIVFGVLVADLPARAGVVCASARVGVPALAAFQIIFAVEAHRRKQLSCLARCNGRRRSTRRPLACLTVAPWEIPSKEFGVHPSIFGRRESFARAADLGTVSILANPSRIKPSKNSTPTRVLPHPRLTILQLPVDLGPPFVFYEARKLTNAPLTQRRGSPSRNAPDR